MKTEPDDLDVLLQFLLMFLGCSSSLLILVLNTSNVWIAIACLFSFGCFGGVLYSSLEQDTLPFIVIREEYEDFIKTRQDNKKAVVDNRALSFTENSRMTERSISPAQLVN